MKLFQTATELPQQKWEHLISKLNKKLAQVFVGLTGYEIIFEGSRKDIISQCPENGKHSVNALFIQNSKTKKL